MDVIETERPKPPPKRGVYILPSALTTANIFFGFYAITSALAGEFDNAAKGIGIAIVLDGLDGRIARLTGTTSKFGVQLDSLADAISFGIAPAVVLWQWHLSAYSYWGWIACFTFLIGGVMRLARFNTQNPELKHFLGLPIPAAAGCIAALVHFVQKYNHWSFFQSHAFYFGLIGLTLILGIMMISTTRYGSFKNFGFRGRIASRNILLMALLLAGIWFFSHEVLLAFALIYFLSGIFGTIRRQIQRRSGLPSGKDDPKISSTSA